jgi:hypothetical protein
MSALPPNADIIGVVSNEISALDRVAADKAYRIFRVDN